MSLSKTPIGSDGKSRAFSSVANISFGNPNSPNKRLCTPLCHIQLLLVLLRVVSPTFSPLGILRRRSPTPKASYDPYIPPPESSAPLHALPTLYQQPHASMPVARVPSRGANPYPQASVSSRLSGPSVQSHATISSRNDVLVPTYVPGYPTSVPPPVYQPRQTTPPVQPAHAHVQTGAFVVPKQSPEEYVAGSWLYRLIWGA